VLGSEDRENGRGFYTIAKNRVTNFDSARKTLAEAGCVDDYLVRQYVHGVKSVGVVSKAMVSYCQTRESASSMSHMLQFAARADG